MRSCRLPDRPHGPWCSMQQPWLNLWERHSRFHSTLQGRTPPGGVPAPQTSGTRWRQDRCSPAQRCRDSRKIPGCTVRGHPPLRRPFDRGRRQWPCPPLRRSPAHSTAPRSTCREHSPAHGTACRAGKPSGGPGLHRSRFHSIPPTAAVPGRFRRERISPAT